MLYRINRYYRIENREDISVRVNGKPAPANIKLSSRNQVGVGGKLFSFYKRLPKK